jgi:hypothetical protein
VKALIDGDPMCYRAAFACKDDSASMARYTIDSIITMALLSCDTYDRWYDSWQIYLTGPANFRNTLAKTAVYKGNRTQPKPKHLPVVRQHLLKEWKAVLSKGEEADDAIAIEATKLNHQCCIISIDKDFMQVPCHIFNPVKREHYFIEPFDGLRSFYKQILTGDAVDNIIGLHGIGPVKAAKLLEECTTERQMYEACIEAYEGNEERVIENGQLLWLRRKEKELWTPPTV